MTKPTRVVAAMLIAITVVNSNAAIAQSALAQEADALEEIVVTATKTGERLRDISGSVSGLTGAQLEILGAQSNQDYLARIPGVVFNGQQPGFSTVTIRGVNTSTNFANLSQSTTGSYINDVPLTDPFFSSGTPDIDVFDVDHVEVHRGPQGTLFGSSALGGAINYIARSADMSRFDAAFQTTQGGSEDGGYNWTYKGMLNLPVVNDRLGVRMVGIARHESGFIDNIASGRSDANDSESKGGRFLAGWQVQDGTKLSWLSLYQKIENRDAPYQDPDLGDLRKNTPVSEPSDTSVLIHNLRLDQHFSFADLVALASYHKKTGFSIGDLKRFGLFGFTLPSVDDSEAASGKTFEIRLLSPRQRPFTWLLGVMYDKTDETILEHLNATNASEVADGLLGPSNGATIGNVWGVTRNDFTGKEKALFGEAAYAFADGLKVTLGGRSFKTETVSRTSGFGLFYAAFVNGQLVSQPAPVSQSDSGFSPKASISYSFNPDSQVYLLASKGFRFGGGNVNPDPSLPRAFSSDSLWNYELGLKSEWLDHKVILDATIFDIEWRDIQLTVDTDRGTTGVVNAGDARIRGAEAEFGWRVTPQFELNSTVTYLDGVLESVHSGPGLAFGVVPGSRLPGSSRWLVSNVLRYEWNADGKPFIVLAHRFASGAPALLQQFAAPARNPTVGNYHLVDLRSGFTFGSVQWALFVSNIANRRAVVSAQYLNPPLADEIHQYVSPPRTYGLSVSWIL